MWERLKKWTQVACDVLELVVAAIVLIGVIIAIVRLVPQLGEYFYSKEPAEGFSIFMEHVLAVVIGIEFLQMLCRPNSDNVVEVLIFLVARHMIVGSTTSLEDFVSVISIILLCLLRRYLHNTKEDRERKLQQEK